MKRLKKAQGPVEGQRKSNLTERKDEVDGGSRCTPCGSLEGKSRSGRQTVSGSHAVRHVVASF